MFLQYMSAKTSKFALAYCTRFSQLLRTHLFDLSPFCIALCIGAAFRRPAEPHAVTHDVPAVLWHPLDACLDSGACILWKGWSPFSGRNVLEAPDENEEYYCMYKQYAAVCTTLLYRARQDTAVAVRYDFFWVTITISDCMHSRRMVRLRPPLPRWWEPPHFPYTSTSAIFGTLFEGMSCPNPASSLASPIPGEDA